MVTSAPPESSADAPRFGLRRRDGARSELSSPRKRWLVVAIAAIVAIATAAFGCLIYSAGPPQWVQDLEAAAAHAGSRGDELRIDSVTDFEWDSLHVFPPYTEPARITEGLGFQWGDGTVEGPSSDSLQLVVFVRDDEVVSWAEIGRCDPGFPWERSGTTGLTRVEGGLTAVQAVFQVEGEQFQARSGPDEAPQTTTCWHATLAPS